MTEFPMVEAKTGTMLIPLSDLDLTDSGNAKLFAYKQKGLFLYCKARNGWLIWDGRRWAEDDKNSALLAAETTIRKMLQMVLPTSSSQSVDLLKHVAKSLGEPRLRAMCALAAVQPELAASLSEFDTNHYYFNCLNGTLDLSRMKFGPHNPKDLITKLAQVEYRPEAECPKWNAFLSEIFADDQEIISFLARVLGVCLTGNTDNQMVLVFHGCGANGKSLTVETIRMVLGEYYQRTKTETLMLDKHKTRGGGEASEDVARLAGVRLAVCMELADGQQLNESLIKDLTGSELISARFCYGHQFDFVPTHKTLLVGNHKPTIAGTDHGIWRRVYLVPFKVCIPLERQVGTSEMLARFRGELPGILNWLVAGFIDLRKNGLRPPAAVVAATAEYKSDQDTTGAFLADCCEQNAVFVALCPEVYQAYEGWCKSNGIQRPKSAITFNRMLRERGFSEPHNVHGYKYWRGLGLKASAKQAGWD